FRIGFDQFEDGAPDSYRAGNGETVEASSALVIARPDGMPEDVYKDAVQAMVNDPGFNGIEVSAGPAQEVIDMGDSGAIPLLDPNGMTVTSITPGMNDLQYNDTLGAYVYDDVLDMEMTQGGQHGMVVDARTGPGYSGPVVRSASGLPPAPDHYSQWDRFQEEMLQPAAQAIGLLDAFDRGGRPVEDGAEAEDGASGGMSAKKVIDYVLGNLPDEAIENWLESNSRLYHRLVSGPLTSGASG
ncbi:MAG: hypothetical protein ABEK12_03300, partial [Candidatus Nanohaloarchaea archaeon]